MHNLYSYKAKANRRKRIARIILGGISVFLVISISVFYWTQGDNSQELLNRGGQEFSNGEFTTSIEYLEGVSESKQNSDSLLMLASAHYNKKEYDKAIQTYEEMIDRYPENPAGYNGIANVYRDKKDQSNAVRYYRSAIEVNPKYSIAYVNYAIMLYDLGQREEARTIAQEGLAQIPDSGELQNVLSLVGGK